MVVRKRQLCFGLLLSWCGLTFGSEALPQAGNSPEVAPSPTGSNLHAPNRQTPNLRTKTFGGIQFWGDVRFFHGWHIQRNIFTGHYRLLDEDDVRHAWGTFDECEQKLAEIRKELQLPPLPRSATIVLHGLGRSDRSMLRLKRHLEKNGHYVISLNYPSLRASLEENAEYLHQVVSHLEGVQSFHLVGYSMGGIVVRRYLAEHRDPRLQRVVFIGTPNRGAELATIFRDWWAFKTITGPSGQELATEPYGIAAGLPCPPCDFGIVAGGRGAKQGYNPLIPGDNDGTVSVESTRLPGAADFITVNALHQSLLRNPTVFEATDQFLQTGQFVPDRDTQPIVSVEPLPYLRQVKHRVADNSSKQTGMGREFGHPKTTPMRETSEPAGNADVDRSANNSVDGHRKR